MQCDFCEREAKYDGKTTFGPWALLCQNCFQNNGIGLGLGKGQTLKNSQQEGETQ